MTNLKLKAVIIDDELPNLDTLDKLIADYCHNLVVVARCQDPIEALETVSFTQPDIVFLDISMPGLSGFDFLNRFSKITFKIIFTTAYSEYAMKAIKYAALDFLLKPIDKVELVAAVNRAGMAIEEEATRNMVDQSKSKSNIALPTQTGYSFVDINDIIYCKSDNSYTEFFMSDEKRITVSRALKDTQEMLDGHGFFRIHQSYLINGKYILKYNKQNNMLLLINEITLPVAYRKKDEFLRFISTL